MGAAKDEIPSIQEGNFIYNNQIATLGSAPIRQKHPHIAHVQQMQCCLYVLIVKVESP